MDAAYCYDRVNHVIMLLIWQVLTNGNIPAIIASLVCLQTIKLFQRTGFGESKTFFGRKSYFPYMMGLGQGNRVAPLSWIQLIAVLVTIFKQLKLGAMIQDPISAELIHMMDALFVDDTDLYTWREHIMDPKELWRQTQIELEKWSCLLNATRGVLKPKKCFWYLLNYDCVNKEWIYVDAMAMELNITNPDGTKSPIKWEKAKESRATLGI